MNKIERAIYDCKLHINVLERDVLVLSTELKSYKKQLDALEAIEYDKSIPHLEEKDKIQGVTMSNELKIQLLRRSCCNTIFAGCVEPYCYTDEDWLKSLKEYVDNGCVVEYVEAGKGLKFESCKCDKIQGDKINEL